MEFTVEKINGIAVVRIQADVLDAGNAKAFKAGISPILEENPNVVLDMSRLNFLDSSGCGALLSCLRQVNGSGGDLKLFGVHKTVRTLFELIRLHRIIDIFDDREAAIRAF